MADTATQSATDTSTRSATQNTPANAPANTPPTSTPPASSNPQDSGTDLDRRIQSAIDRATQKLGTENKSLRDEIQKLKTANMTDAEKHAADLEERERAVQEREAQVKVEKNRMHAITALKNAGLDDGSTTVVDLIDLVMGADDKAIDKNVAALQSLVNKMVAAEVDKTFKERGRNPVKGNSAPDDEKNKDKFVSELGKRTAETVKKSRGVLDLYTGGKK